MVETPTPAIWRITLPHGVTAVPVARAMVRTAMQDLKVTADRTTAQLLTTELVTNALKHTCGTHPIELVVERAKSGCRIEVHDNDPMLIDELLDATAPASGAVGEAGTARAPGTATDGSGAGDARAAEAPGGSGPVRWVKRSATADGAPSAVEVPAADEVAAADGTRTRDGHRAADDRVPAQRAGGAGGSEGDGDEGGDDAGESTETGDAGASTETPATETRAPSTPFIDAAEAAEAAETVEAVEAAARDSHGHGDQGRGLLLLRSLSSDAGCRPTACGKAVWFTLPDLPHRRRR